MSSVSLRAGALGFRDPAVHTVAAKKRDALVYTHCPKEQRFVALQDAAKPAAGAWSSGSVDD